MVLSNKKRKSLSKKIGSKRKTRSKRGGTKSKKVYFKSCNSDSDCTLDKPECDTKNYICVQKFKFIGGKTKKRCSIDKNIIY